MGEAGFESRFVSASDGLKLHVRVYGVPQAGRLPLVCLAGLSRNAADFDVLARAISGSRQVIAPDYRGRGLSDWDPDWQRYALPVELQDVLTMAAALDVGKAVFLGTSRGGLLTMAMAAIQPAMLAGAILNDIGPVIDGAGLARIKGYLGTLAEPATLDAAVALLRNIGGARFPALSEADWRRQAEGMWTLRDGRLRSTFDPALAKTLEQVDFDAPLPTLWPQFDALANVPTMVIRGEHSDILSAETVAAMASRRSGLDVLDVPGQGHAPLLADAMSIGRIRAFIDCCDPV